MEQDEVREELPFRSLFESLTYIGIVSRQSWDVEKHEHDHFELCYVDEGEGWFAIDQFLYEVEAGDLFLTKPGERHQGAASGRMPYRLYYLGFQIDGLRSVELDYIELGVKRVVKDTSGAVKRICDHIFDEINGQQLHANVIVQGYFLQMLVSVIRAYQGDGSGGHHPRTVTPAVKTVLSHLHEYVRFHHDVRELANKVHLSRTHLEREFKRCMGVPLGHYIRSLCLDRAKYWLGESNDSVTAIAERLEFGGIHHFSLFFKRLTGISPLAYRQQAAKQPRKST
ncbi:helix-turn-helix domain-containing protein [Paenibacillus sepulcri]|uniref:AraC family transcriptional regulator n=1 Tax=Paenibacillus sepulcri TaxID=359917 RepID=A0ABS7C6X4_9BACL|nr:AraC family transcriptional regulator [Paenibacillus sepulcri]